jgi:hypothetical protein
MELKKTVEIPAKTEERVVAVTCDICGKKGHPEWPGGDWGENQYDRNETIVRWRQGEHYPEGSSGNEYDVHICPTCFENKLMPWLKEQGVNLIEKSYEF